MNKCLKCVYFTECLLHSSGVFETKRCYIPSTEYRVKVIFNIYELSCVPSLVLKGVALYNRYEDTVILALNELDRRGMKLNPSQIRYIMKAPGQHKTILERFKNENYRLS